MEDATNAARPRIYMRDLAYGELIRIRDNIVQMKSKGKALTAVQCKVYGKNAKSVVDKHNGHDAEMIKLISRSSKVHNAKYKQVFKLLKTNRVAVFDKVDESSIVKFI